MKTFQKIPFDASKFPSLSKDGWNCFSPNRVKLDKLKNVLFNTQTQEKKDKVAKWRVEVGEDEAKKIIEHSTKFNAAVRKMTEWYLNGRDDWESHCFDENSFNAGHSVAMELNAHVTGVYGTNLWVMEEAFAVCSMVEGLVDWDGVPSIIQIEGSRTEKKDDWLADAVLHAQMCVALAKNQSGMDIKQIVLFEALHDGYCKVRLISFDQAAVDAGVDTRLH